jgi:sulfur-oxidizing protein SoxZ
MSQAIRIRARLKDGVTEALVLMPHPMETGLRRSASGALIPAHYITDVNVSVEGRRVFSAHMSLAVSQDPLLSFRFRGAKQGDRVEVSWLDNQGDRRVDVATIV